MIPADVIPWRRRRTARWLSLSLAARGAVEGIVAAMNERGELQLPAAGLQALAVVLGRPWTEVEPAVREVFASGKLRFHPERLLVSDPSREERHHEDAQELGEIEGLHAQIAAARAQLEDLRRLEVAVSDKARSLTPAAERARAWRAAQRAKKAASTAPPSDSRQVEMFAGVREPFANAFANGPPADSGVISERSRAFAERSRTPPSLSDLPSVSKKQREARAPGFPLDASAMPTGWLDHARTKRPDLPEGSITSLWRLFAAEKTGKFTSWPVVQARWERWLEQERLVAPAPSGGQNTPASPPRRPEAVPPYYGEAKLAKPDVEPEAPVSAPRRVVRLVHDEAVRAAAARLAAGIFVPLPPEPRSMSA